MHIYGELAVFRFPLFFDCMTRNVMIFVGFLCFIAAKKQGTARQSKKKQGKADKARQSKAKQDLLLYGQAKAL